jgi:hypothetical protein
MIDAKLRMLHQKMKVMSGLVTTVKHPPEPVFPVSGVE